MSRPAWILAHPDGPLVDGLLAVAWADGAVAPEERAALDGLLELLELQASEVERAAWRESRPDADEVADAVTDPGARLFLLDRALLLAASDGEVAAEETALVERWAARWGIDEATLDELREGVAGRLAGSSAP